MYREEIATISNGAEAKVRLLKETLADILLCHYSEEYT